MHSRFLTSVAFLSVVAASVAMLPQAVDAQDVVRRGGPAGVRLDAHLDIGWYGNAGVGFRVDIPIVQDGLLDTANDDLSISLGAEFLWWYHKHYGGFGVFPIAALQWNFYLNEYWSIFPELGVTLAFGPSGWNEHYYPAYVLPFLGFGARYHFSPRNAVLFRVNFPAGFQIGITF